VARWTEAQLTTRFLELSLSELVNGKSGISPEMAIRLEKAFGSSARHWMQLQLNYDLWHAEQRASALRVERLQPA
jgi:addiction module HigA family antidote